MRILFLSIIYFIEQVFFFKRTGWLSFIKFQVFLKSGL